MSTIVQEFVVFNLGDKSASERVIDGCYGCGAMRVLVVIVLLTMGVKQVLLPIIANSNWQTVDTS